jgi:hypothetical protein
MDLPSYVTMMNLALYGGDYTLPPAAFASSGDCG